MDKANQPGGGLQPGIVQALGVERIIQAEVIKYFLPYLVWAVTPARLYDSA